MLSNMHHRSKKLFSPVRAHFIKIPKKDTRREREREREKKEKDKKSCEKEYKKKEREQKKKKKEKQDYVLMCMA